MINFNFESNNKYEDNIIDSMNKFLYENKYNEWYNLDIDLNSIKKLACDINNKYDAMVVIGIGGSYIGSKAIIEGLNRYKKSNSTEVIFIGNNLSSDYVYDILEYIENKDICINVISKSGDTLETLLCFDIFLDYMKNKYVNFKNRIIVTTNSESGQLLDYCNQYGFKRLNISNNTVGRYSVISEVGLFPVAVAGYDIEKIVLGAKECKSNLEKCYQYISLRQEMYDKNIFIESFDVYEPKLYSLTEWIKQLFNETQGKQKKGILALSTINTTDLHSIEQYYQDGKLDMFSTVIFSHSNKNIYVKKYNKNLDNINEIVAKSVIKERSHKIKSSLIELDEINEKNLGYLMFFFEISAMCGAYLLGINYYNQPGVEKYKNTVNSLLN